MAEAVVASAPKRSSHPGTGCCRPMPHSPSSLRARLFAQAFAQDQNIPSVFAAIFHAGEELAHEMNSQPAGFALVNVQSGIRLGSFQRIEFTSVIGHHRSKLGINQAERDLDLMFVLVVVTVFENIRKDFLEDEVHRRQFDAFEFREIVSDPWNVTGHRERSLYKVQSVLKSCCHQARACQPAAAPMPLGANKLFETQAHL
jgi:hypothetical protein